MYCADGKGCLKYDAIRELVSVRSNEVNRHRIFLFEANQKNLKIVRIIQLLRNSGELFFVRSVPNAHEHSNYRAEAVVMLTVDLLNG